jgi:hypothetical protein
MSTQGPYTGTTHRENSGAGSIALGGRGKKLHLSTLPRERKKDRVVQIQVSHPGGKICEETQQKNPSGHVATAPKSRWLMHHLLIAGHTLSALFLVESDEDISSFGRSRF